MKKHIYNLYLLYKYTFCKTKIYFSGTKKSSIKILWELLIWLFNEHKFNTMYYAFGLNMKGTYQNEYIGRREFLRIKNKTEKKIKSIKRSQNLNFDVVTKDKFYANSVFASNGISCIEHSAVIINGMVVLNGGVTKDLIYLLDLKQSFYIKNTILEAGEGVFACKVKGDKIEANGLVYSVNEFKILLKNYTWVLQDKINSIEEISKINASALNTTRIVTILNGTIPEYLAGFQAFATNNATTDSWNHGSIYVGIDTDEEVLKNYGFHSLSIKDKALAIKHPDTEIIFKGYRIPYIKDAILLCLNAHKYLYSNFIIGWDVAITSEGPLIVEANEKPGMNVAQCVDGGLRFKIRDYASKIR